MKWATVIDGLNLSGMAALKEHKGRGGESVQTRIVLGARLMQILAELQGVPGTDAAQVLIVETLEGLGQTKAIKAAYKTVKPEDDGDFKSAL